MVIVSPDAAAGSGAVSSASVTQAAAVGGCGVAAGAAWAAALPVRRVRTTSEPPCTSCDAITTTPQSCSIRSAPGRPANTGSETSSSELSPRGPYQATMSRGVRPIPLPASAAR